MLAVMFEFAKRVADRSPPLNSTSTTSAFAMFITLSVMAFTSSFEYMCLDVCGKRSAPDRRAMNLSRRRQSGTPVRHAQPAPPAPQPPPAGSAREGARSAAPDDPTIPGTRGAFLRFDPRHAGQPAVRLVVTKASKVRPQSRHSYSNSGMAT